MVLVVDIIIQFGDVVYELMMVFIFWVKGKSCCYSYFVFFMKVCIGCLVGIVLCVMKVCMYCVKWVFGLGVLEVVFLSLND